MKLHRYAVAPKGTGEWTWVTTFVQLPTMWCSLPSAKEGQLDTINFMFKKLTEAEYESYIEFDSLRERESDDFVIWGTSDSTQRRLEAEQAAFELHELDDVFDQSE